MAAPTFNDQVQQAMIRHQIGLLQYSAKVKNDIWKLLDASEDEIRHEIEDRLRNDAGAKLTPAGLNRMNRLLDVLKETRLKSWKDVNEKWLEEMGALVQSEPVFLAKIIGTAVPVELGLEMPSPSTLKAIVTSKPFEGATMKEWASDLAKKDIARIQRAVRIGMTQGESTREIAARIVGTVSDKGTSGVTQITRNNAAAITRTAVTHITAEAREEMFLANADIMTQKVFVATLDSGTTEFCMAHDGIVYDINDPAAPVFPTHWGERSMYSPVFDGEVVGQRPARGVTNKQVMREFAEDEDLDEVPTSRNKIPHGLKTKFDKFSNNRIGEMTGQVPAKTTYSEFLGKQSNRFQADVLGVTKAKLFRAGAPLKGFVARDGSALTLAELATSHEEWFRAAGLEPLDFTLD